MLRDDEKQWLAAAEVATPGEWKNDGWDCFAESEYSIVVTASQSNMLIMIETTVLSHEAKDCQAWKDADFIASARTAVPILCQRLEAMAEALRERMSGCKDCQWEWVPSHAHYEGPCRKLVQRCDLCRKAVTLLEGRGT